MGWGEGANVSTGQSTGQSTGPSTGPSLTDLLSAIERFCGDFSAASSPSDLGSQLMQLRAGMDRLEYMFSLAAGTFAATDEYENQGATSATEWLRHNCKMTSTAAAERICVGEQLERMPQMVESLFAGLVGFGHLAHTARTARKLSNSKTGVGFDETALLEMAEGMSVGKFGYACRDFIHSLDPEGVANDEQAAAEMRDLSLTTGPDGQVFIRAQLDPAGGAVVRTALEALARPSGADDHRLYGQRMGDALVEAMFHVMEIGALPTRGGQRVHLQVTASFDTMKASLGAPGADMEFSLPISAAMARKWACDCSFTRIILNSDSIPIDVGRQKRIVPGATRKALLAQYQCCPFPGCNRPISWTQVHHIKHWIDGGESTLENSLPLCFRHHAMVHEGWTLVRTETGLIAVPPSRGRVRFVCDPETIALA